MRIDKAKKTPAQRTLNLTRPLQPPKPNNGRLSHSCMFVQSKQSTYLSSAILRSTLRLRELSLSSALATISERIVAARISTRIVHDVSCAADGRVDIMVVRTGTTRLLMLVMGMGMDIVVGSMRMRGRTGRRTTSTSVLRRVDDCCELCS